MRAILVIALEVLTLSLIALCCQSQADPSDPKFAQFVYEVVSIKPTNFHHGLLPEYAADGLKMSNCSLRLLIQRAYRVQDFQVIGASSWIDSEKFDVEAKMEDSVADAFKKLSMAEKAAARQEMLQAMLHERFKLTVHHETREVPVFFLQVTKSGYKLHIANLEAISELRKEDGDAAGIIRIMSRTPDTQHLQAQSVSLSQLAQMLTRMSLGRPVLDKTRLSGRYDFTLTYAPERQSSPAMGDVIPSASDPAGASIFTALKEQLGLKLVSGKGDVEFIVIDHVERPDKN